MNPAVKKGFAIVGVALLLLLPLAWLHGLVSERTALREQAIAAVARGWGGRQMLAGPILAIPVTTTLDNGHTQTRDWYVLPESLDLDVDVTVNPERRKLGVYEVPVYVATVHAKGQFDLAREMVKLMAGDGQVRVHADRGRLFLPLSDPRGVREIKLSEPRLTTVALEPWRGFPIPVLAAPLRADVGSSNDKQPFELTYTVAGTQSLAFLPFAHASHVKLRGNWPAPGFASGFLPAERHVHSAGFDATWQVSDLNRSYGARWMEGDVAANDLQDSSFGVDLVQPVDLYQQIERAVKYAGVFIGLSFLTLFIWEHLVRRPVHPIQYAFMGLALSVFFLLLLALAEHLGFRFAYVLAALALCSLLGVYLAGAMGTPRAGAASSGLFALLYGLLYLLVTSDDYALLAGALGLFAVLAVAMVLTRKINWYQAIE
ncbi:MAG: cell envelope integrity protein CreD [Steroidobacteraceae bacterium]